MELTRGIERAVEAGCHRARSVASSRRLYNLRMRDNVDLGRHSGLSGRAGVRMLFVSSAIVLALIVAVALDEDVHAPRINLRWQPGTSEAERVAAERQLGLANAAFREGETWAYDLVDAGPARVAAVVTHPLVADTHYIDKSANVVVPDAPQGTLVLSRARFHWIRDRIPSRKAGTFFGVLLVNSGLWLAWHRRRRPDAV